MRRFDVLLAPRVNDDVQRHITRLQRLEAEGEIRSGYSDAWYAAFETTLIGLQLAAERHPFAPEGGEWGRDVRNALFADYRILYVVLDDRVWVMRVRHQRQAQLRRPGTGTVYPG